MIIVLEGPDGTGKTTLANKLVEVWNAKARRGTAHYIHSTYRRDQRLWDCAALRWAVKISERGGLAVLDRHWPGDNVYGQVYRQKGGIWTRRQDSVLQRYGALYVLALAPVDFVVEHHAKLKGLRKEMYSDNMREVACRYHDMYYGNITRYREGMDYVEQISCCYPWRERADNYVYDITRVSSTRISRVAHDLIDRARVLRRVADPLLNFHSSKIQYNFSGSVYSANTLIIGRYLSGLSACATKWPLMHDEPWSIFINDALHVAQINEKDLAWMSVIDEDGNEPDLPLILSKFPRRPQLVAISPGVADLVQKIWSITPDAVIPGCEYAWKTMTPMEYGRHIIGSMAHGT